MNKRRSALERAREWVDGLASQSAAAERLGCTQPMLSRVLAGLVPINLQLATAIERETRADQCVWPILATEWTDPPPAREYERQYGRKPGVRRKRGAGK